MTDVRSSLFPFRRLRLVRRQSWRIGLFPATNWYGVDVGYWRFIVVWK